MLTGVHLGHNGGWRLGSVVWRLLLAGGVLGVMAGVATGASTAQAACVSDDASSPCYWMAPAYTTTAYSPNLVQQAAGKLWVNPVTYGDKYAGWKFIKAGDWDECTVSPKDIGAGAVNDVCSSVSLGTIVHVDQITSLQAKNKVWLAFPSGL